MVAVSTHDEEASQEPQPGEVEDLTEQLQVLEDEVASLRRRLQDAPKRVRTLEERLLETCLLYTSDAAENREV